MNGQHHSARPNSPFPGHVYCCHPVMFCNTAFLIEERKSLIVGVSRAGTPGGPLLHKRSARVVAGVTRPVREAEERTGGGGGSDRQTERRQCRGRRWFVERKKFEALLHHCQRKNLAACRSALGTPAVGRTDRLCPIGPPYFGSSLPLLAVTANSAPNSFVVPSDGICREGRGEERKETDAD